MLYTFLLTVYCQFSLKIFPANVAIPCIISTPYLK